MAEHPARQAGGPSDEALERFFGSVEQSFIVRLAEALGLRTEGLVSFRLSAGEDGTPLPRIRAEYVIERKFGEAAEKVAREFSLVAAPTSQQAVGLVDKSVCLSTLFETTHRAVDSQAPHCSETFSALAPTVTSHLKG